MDPIRTRTRSLSQGIPVGHGDQILRTLSWRSQYSETSEQSDVESTKKLPFSTADGWSMVPEVIAYNDANKVSHIKERKLGVTWNNLTVKGLGVGAAIHENVISQFNLAQKIREFRRGTPEKIIINNSHGCVKPGEMLLVLGKPGAGCTTLLKMLSNRRLGYSSISGDVFFGSLPQTEAKQYRGQIVMNTEDEVFFPTLSVGQTMDFATRMKVPHQRSSQYKSEEAFQVGSRDFLLRSMGIEHTSSTKVGNEYVRGVSGGERKRVSIIECLATRGSVFCWDNSTRGLDASTALQWAQAVRALTDIEGLATIATLYQAGNGIYNLFDKVLVLDEGRQIYYGTRDEARPFMEKLGFLCDDSANVADFLTGVTVPTERAIKPGYESRFPRNADEIQLAYQQSSVKDRFKDEHQYPGTDDAKSKTSEFVAGVTSERHKSLPKNSPFTVPFKTQVKACVIRQYQILWGDKASFIIKQGSTLIQALVIGSLFYMAPDNSGGLFLKGGALFFALLYNSLMAMSEVTDSFTGRPVLAKHKDFALYHPAAFCIAQIAADVPIILMQVSVFAIILYFMVGLKLTAAAFFTFWIVVLSTTFCMTALFRLIGAAFSSFDAASKVSGFLISALIMYTGYMIPKAKMHPWFVWIYWIDPLAYAFQSLLDNEFHDQTIPCVGINLIPSGNGYNDRDYQACSGVGGASRGANTVTGDQYLSSLAYSNGNLWRNLGIVWLWWVLCVALTIFFTSHWKSFSGSSGFLLVPREFLHQAQGVLKKDEEAQDSEKSTSEASNQSSQVDASLDQTKAEEELVRNTSVFTWKNLTYTVKTPDGDRVLLNDVQGWVKPGMLGALMGSSGAGKTTLLDVLAQRKTEGTIKGSILVDGRPLSVSFQRSAGYVEQMDVHEPYATVKEALEFSALLRQSRGTPKEEKLRYVDKIIDLLELHDIKNTLIGQGGAGLSIEQRKRVTIGVELVSKPSILIFLDEPTSGLDGQAAFNTLRFLKKLSAAGQAVLCTIHQPSAQLFAQFDTLLLLAKGGKTVYFGDIGENASTVKNYFARHGLPCPPAANPSEHMIDVVSGSLSKGRDWNEVWLQSPEHEQVVAELDRLISDAAARDPDNHDDGREFATTLWEQIRIVTKRMTMSIFRNTEYVNNKLALHVGSALFNGFSFWKIGDSNQDLQLALFSIFNFIFVSVGVINQLQPLFIERRNIYDTREKKSKMYSWIAFVTALIVSELPYLIICGILYFVCWYYTVGFPTDANKAGAFLFVMLVYELVYTGIGQFIAAYAPNAVFASLANPLLIGTLVAFCGVLVPYSQITAFWRYWLYYMNPFTYLMGSLMTFSMFDKPVNCANGELAVFDIPPSSNASTCASYLASYLAPGGFGSHGANLMNPDAISGCEVCSYSRGSDYLYTLNIKDYYYGWRDAALVVLFAVSSYGLVYVLMKARTKTSKKAE